MSSDDLVETVSNTQIIKTAFLKRFINSTNKLSCSAKIATKSVFNIIKNDCRSATGMDLRPIMLLFNARGKDTILGNSTKGGMENLPN